MKLLTTIVSALQEAADELRVHRGRIVLSLLGIAVAVGGFTAVTGMGQLVQYGQSQANDRYSGRDSSYTVRCGAGSAAVDARDVQDRCGQAFEGAVRHYGIGYTSRERTERIGLQFPAGVQDASLLAVDPDYGEMRRLALQDGSWLTAEDAERVAPAVVVDYATWQEMGRPPLSERPTIEFVSPTPLRAIVVGVLRQSPFDDIAGNNRTVYALHDALSVFGFDPAAAPDPETAAEGGDSVFGTPGQGTSYLMWLPPRAAAELAERIEAELEAAAGAGASVSVTRTDSYQYGDTNGLVGVFVAVVSAVVLSISALGYVNISIMAVSQRMRETGIRRAFGASSGRVFCSVLLESLVGSTIAGMAGIVIASMILRAPAVVSMFTFGMADADTVPFPVEAAVAGLIVSVGVGLTTGIAPAVVATRVRVIDAIRGL